MELGLDESRFLDQTPRTFVVILEAAQRRREHAHNELVWLAFNGAAFQRAKRLTHADMTRLLIRRRDKRRPQTWQDMREIARMITLANGGKVH